MRNCPTDLFLQTLVTHFNGISLYFVSNYQKRVKAAVRVFLIQQQWE